MTREGGHEYTQSHQLAGEVMLLQLNREADEVLQAARSSNGGVTAKTLIKDGPLRLVLVGIRAGATLREHRAGGPVAIQPLQGAVEVTSSGRADAIQPREVLTFATDVVHSVTARDDAVLLLTIAWPQT